MNDSVKATGMNVSAKGDQIYLQISDSQFDADDNGKKMTELKINNAAVELLPTCVREDVDNPFDDESTQKGETFIWATNVGKDAEDGTASGAYTKLEDTTGYVLENTMYIRLDPTTGALVAAKPLDVKGVAFGTGSSDTALKNCVSVLVVCGKNAQLWKNNGSTFTQAGGDEYINANSSNKFDNSTTGVEVKVYVFFDGDNPACTLKNLADAKANGNTFAVDIEFSVVA
jgi:hypothetical protein